MTANLSEHLHYESAVARVRASHRKAIYLCVSINAEHAQPGGSAADLIGTLKVTKPQAIAYLQAAFHSQQRKEMHLVTISDHPNTLFIG